MDLGLRSKVVMISGASRGLGLAMAEALGAEGARLSLCARGAEALEKSAADLRSKGYEVCAEAADVADGAQAARWVETTVQRMGGVDVLVNNAGGARPGPLHELDDAAWQSAFELNFFSAVRLARLCAPQMERRGGGSIINISSIASTHSLGYSCISYSASKGAVNAFTRDIALNYGPKKIRCNTILPGLMNTPLIHKGNVTDVYGSTENMVRQRDALVPLGTMGNAWDVAHAAVFLASDESRYITGIELVVDGGITLKVK